MASDWTLVARFGPWVDHFAAPLDDGNHEFVRTHGKWSAVDLPSELAEALVGSNVSAASLLYNEMGEVDGVPLATETATVIASQWGGNLQVRVERD